MERAIRYIQESWPEISAQIYRDCISHSIIAQQSLPQWYVLEKDHELIGCAGLITNDFISRMDLYPWLCAMFISEAFRGKGYAALLIEQAKIDTAIGGFRHLNLCTDHVGYYEKFGFNYIGQGYHPWGEESRIYQIEV
ncbi:GNAT family N-acetyltransferase [Sphingobacterium hungaricum]|uniref:GNAT family N-acetyltransferase n=1 Tax=Sphingobacterium hungaricum TaxID=2082723 RepID=A0A928UV00_9SPHI|nr:GNAT family N-acetyltransferase [Sphingobacterium hungaricum]MBE8713836.1 GNAT family N-acetyltransferase [Sphingobacterium hungaricum]